MYLRVGGRAKRGKIRRLFGRERERSERRRRRVFGRERERRRRRLFGRKRE
jgi:hypothetical protein